MQVELVQRAVLSEMIGERPEDVVEPDVVKSLHGSNAAEKKLHARSSSGVRRF